VLDRVIAWQVKTISWHRDEGRRLREQEARIRDAKPWATQLILQKTMRAISSAFRSARGH